MATGRIGVTPTLRTRWSKQPSAGTTSLSGLDDNSVALVYDVGYEAVYRNGTLLSRGNDYTATNGTTVTLVDATLAGDIIEILANQLVPLTNAISNGQFTAKGALLSATAASTPGVLAVGTNGQYLSADSTASTGLAWSTLSSSKSWSLLNTGGTALTGAATITVSGISGKDNLLIVVDVASSASAASTIKIRFNADSGASNYSFGAAPTFGSTVNNNSWLASYDSIVLGDCSSNAASTLSGWLTISGANNAGLKTGTFAAAGNAGGGTGQTGSVGAAIYKGTSTISSVSIISGTGNFDAGTIYVYGAA